MNRKITAALHHRLFPARRRAVQREITRPIEGLGNVRFRFHPRASRLRIILRPLQGIQVNVPEDVSLSLAEAFVREKEDWIRRQIPAIQAKEASQTIFTEETPFSTRRHRLEIRRMDRSKPWSRVEKNLIRIRLPHGLPAEDPVSQGEIRRAIERAWRREAKEMLPPRTRELARRHEFRYREVVIKNIRSRWGSCSPAGRINLSLHLMRLPDHLIDYVILHELTHLEIPRHGAPFWNRLEEILPQARQAHREIRGWNPRYY